MDRLVSASDLVKKNTAHFPNESAEYRRARNELLVQEIELRRQIERVAEQRRHLPPGGEVKKDYVFVSENGPVHFKDLFAGKNTLMIYNYMFGPQREKPCPMCTSFMSTWEKKLPDFEQRVSFIFVARSPIERLVAFKEKRGWKNMKVFSDTDGAYTRDYVSKDDADIPGYAVFEKDGGVIRHFWSGEISGEMTDPGQDPRGAPDFDPLWLMLDTTREGRGTNWYPKLEY
jgi:predicted dithiol-disulfide oxidoreductase (DUF899 family)